MKKEIEIKFKIAVHEAEIDKLLDIDRSEWRDHYVELVERYLQGRKALLWVLSDEEFIKADEYEKKVMFECMCHKSSKIF